MFYCFGLRFCPPTFEKSQIFKVAKKAGKILQTWTQFYHFCQVTGQTWHHINLSALDGKRKETRKTFVGVVVVVEGGCRLWGATTPAS